MRKYAFFTSILISSIPLLLLSFFFFNEIKSVSEDRIVESIQREVDIASKNLDDFLVERIGNLTEWSTSPIVSVALEFSRPEGLTSNLNSLIKTYPSYEWITVIDSENKIFATTLKKDSNNLDKYAQAIKEFKGSGSFVQNDGIFVVKEIKNSGLGQGKILSKISNVKINNFITQLKGHIYKIPSDLVELKFGEVSSNSKEWIYVCPKATTKYLIPICASVHSKHLAFEIANLRSIFIGVTLALISLTFFIINNIFTKLTQPFDEIHKSLLSISAHKYLKIDLKSNLKQLVLIEDRYNKVVDEIRTSDEISKDLAHNQALFDISRQVAHDIRSPVAALGVAIDQLTEMPKEVVEIIEHSIIRINDIANELLDRNTKTRVKVFNPNNVLNDIIIEKKVQIGNGNIKLIKDFHHDALILMDPAAFSRLASNILNNSVEALKNGQGEIGIKVFVDTKVHIHFKDNGIGIPHHILNQLGEKGATFGKNSTGSGLGLHHAISTIENFGGKLVISSDHGSWTEIRIELPFIKKNISFPANSLVMIIDDDQLIHDAWINKLEMIGSNIEIKYFYSPEEFIYFCNNQTIQKNSYAFVDYEFRNSNLTGLDIIANKGFRNWFLVTNRYDDPYVIKQSSAIQASIIPKSLLSEIQFQIDSGR